MAENTAPEDNGAAQAADPGEAAAQQVIAAFGGIRPMASKLGVAVSTVQGWKERNAIPAGRHAEIRAAAVRHGVSLSAATVAASEHPPIVVPEQEVIPPDTPATDAAREADTKPAEAAKPGEAPRSAAQSPGKSKVPESSSAGRRTEGAGDSTKPPPRREPPPSSPATPRRGGWIVPFILGAVALGAGAAIAVVSVDLWRGDGGGGNGSVAAGLAEDLEGLRGELTEQTGALETLKAELAARPAGEVTGTAPEVTRGLEKLGLEAGELAARLARLEQSAGAPGATPEELQALADASRGLENRLGAIETRLAGLGRLEQDLADLKARPTGGGAATGGDLALLLAIVQLRDALGGSSPYASQLEGLRAAVAGDAELSVLADPLAARAATGVPTTTQLAQSFSELTTAIVSAGAGDEADGPLSGVMRRIGEVITVRPVGNVEGGGTGAVVARAEYRLAGGDLTGAVTELDGLSRAAAEAVAEWRAEAGARLAADAALADLAGKAVTRFTSGGG